LALALVACAVLLTGSVASASGNVYIVLNGSDSGPGSLSQAITDANGNPGLDTIDFNISGTPTITPTDANPLPAITDPVKIDGTSQASVTIDGTGLSGSANGLDLSAGSDGSTVTGLTIENMPGDGVSVGSDGNLVSGTHLSNLAGNGITVAASHSGNLLTSNTFSAITGDPIHLQSGANDGQPTPALTSVHTDGALVGSLTAGAPNSTYAIEVLSGSTCGTLDHVRTGHDVATDGSGNAAISFSTDALSAGDAVAIEARIVSTTASAWTVGDSSQLSSCATVTNPPTPNLAVTLPDGGRVAGADPSDLTATVSNTGSADSTGGSITFTLPAGGKLLFGSGTCATPSGQTLTCTLPTVPHGGSVPFSVPIKATADALGDYTVQAVVSDPSELAADQGAENTATDTVTVTAQSDETVTLADAALVAGGSATNLSASVQNAGPSDSGAVTVTYTLPSSGDLVFEGLPTNGCTKTDDLNADCTISNVAATQSASTGSLPVRAIPSALGSESVQVKVAAATEPSSALGNDSGSNTVSVTGEADLSVTPLTNNPTVDIVAGRDNFTTTATVLNGGPSDSHDYSVTLHLTTATGGPTGDIQFVAPLSSTDCTLTAAGDITCDRTTSLAKNRTLKLPTFTVQTNHQALGTYNVVATVVPTTPLVTDPNTDPDGRSSTTTGAGVIARTILTVTNSSSSFATHLVTGTETANLVYANADPTRNGVTYTITISAASGLSDARNVTLTDDVNAGAPSTNLGAVKPLSATICGYNIPTVGTANGCTTLGTAGVNVGTYVPGASHTYTVTATANPGLLHGGYLFADANGSVGTGNVANLASDTPDLNAVSYPKRAPSGHKAFIATFPDAPQNLVAIPGSLDAGLTWNPPASDGGSPVQSFTIQTTASNGAVIADTPIDLAHPPAGFNIVSATASAPTTYQYQFNNLSNAGVTYTFKVVATNQVGTGAQSNAASATPSANNSATVFTGSTSPETQTTGTGVVSTGDPQVEQQQFTNSTKGLASILECQATTCNSSSSTGAATTNLASSAATFSINGQTFCNGKCIGVPSVTKLLGTATGRYVVTLLYSKSLIPNTSVNHVVYWLANPAAGGNGAPLLNCPTKGPLPPSTPCVLKLVSHPASNPALAIQVSVPQGLTDPGWGAK
jgi:hypothetical protein